MANSQMVHMSTKCESITGINVVGERASDLTDNHWNPFGTMEIFCE